MNNKSRHNKRPAGHFGSTRVYAQKDRLRKKLLTRLDEICHDEVVSASKNICRQLTTLPQLRGTLHIATYASIGNEIDIGPFAVEAIRRGIKIYYPRFNSSRCSYELALVLGEKCELITGYMGILEPKSNYPIVDDDIKRNELLWLVPGMAFDEHGHRLGRGKGHYDRLLEGVNGVKVGIAYDWQIVQRVPVNSADVSMNYLLTATRYLSCRN